MDPGLPVSYFGEDAFNNPYDMLKEVLLSISNRLKVNAR